MTAKKPETAVIPDGAIDYDALLAKREDVIGSRDKFPFIFAGEVFWIIDPTVASDAFNDEMKILGLDNRDAEDDLKEADSREERLEIIEDVKTTREALLKHMFGGDQDELEKFLKAGGSTNILQEISVARQHQVQEQRGTDPTQPTSRATRRRQKRR